MSKNQVDIRDQAEVFREKVKRDPDEVNDSSSVDSMTPASSLPPRSQVHAKAPPMKRAPFYIGGAVVLALAIGGGGWWYLQGQKSTPTAASAAAGNIQPVKGVQERPPAETDEAAKPTVIVPPAPKDSKEAKVGSPAPTAEVSAVGAVSKKAQPSATGSAKAPAAKPDKPESSAVLTTKRAEAESPEPRKKKNRVVYHRIQQGETLYKISKRYYQTGRYQYYLANYNGIKDTTNVIVGTVIAIPMPPR
ncbi:LysM peptidoglycan-binding domain-containing protein [Aneurinibacillus terranovensis]|uniref:LysM peptidoglycan-binding domain-containing protein n=1 Tax=Aneurinibacillus terranovensis TaxID=278991 RepID=UPI0003FE1182|nr:LysM domain-containing protein [Aneurinibacillus terranovensis]